MPNNPPSNADLTRDKPESIHSDEIKNQATFLSLATLIVSGANYGYSLAVIRLLPSREYAQFASVQGLLLVMGTASMAAIPWAVARYVALNDTRQAAREALHFGLVAAFIQGVVMAAAAGLVIGTLAGTSLGVITGAAAFCLSLVVAPLGFLQGYQKLKFIAYLRAFETALRLTIGLLFLFVVSRSASSAILGFPIASALIFFIGLSRCRRAFPLKVGNRLVLRELLRQSVLLGLIQLFIATLAALDTVVVLVSHLRTNSIASYQVAALLGRIPLFLSTAISVSYYQPLAKAKDDREAGRTLERAVLFYLLISVPMVALLASIPVDLVRLVSPSHPDTIASLLRYTSISGSAIGLINIVTTSHQARGKFRSAITVLLPIATIQPLLLVIAGRQYGIVGFAQTLAAISVTAAAIVVFDARRWTPLGQIGLVELLGLGVAVGLCILTLKYPILWSGEALLLCAMSLMQFKRGGEKYTMKYAKHRRT